MANSTDTEEIFANNSPWLVAFLIIFSVQGTLGNILIILSVAMEKTLRTHTDAFIVNVAVMDLIITGVLFPTMVPSLIFERNVYSSACQYMAFVFSSLLTCSLASLTVVAINRYLFICQHALYSRVFSQRSMVVMLVGCWLFGFLVFIPTLLGWGKTGYVPQTAMCGYQHEESLGHVIFVFVVVVIVPIIITYTSYGLIAFTLWKSTQRIAAHDGNSQNQTARKRKHTQVRTMFIISALFTLFWFPYGMVCIFNYAQHVPVRYVQATTWLGDCNSCANSVVLGLVNKKYRAAYRKVICCLWRQKSQNPNSISVADK